VQLATTLGIANSIEFTGWLPREYLPDAYDDATALVVPSVIDSEGDRDGLPNVILEAFACRVPVIASDLAGIKEAVWHEITGLLVAAGDEDKLADAMLRLLGDSTLGRQLADNARRMLNEKYDADENVRRALSLLSATISAEDTAGRFTCC
jgi:glycosyltransferase involved in cell wall biosynthesis